MSSIDNLTQAQAAYLLQQLMFEDFLRYAPAVLKVQTTRGKIVPFTLNRPQMILHTIIEKYIKPFRPVRIIGLKSRRMGFSTYFSGRYYWKTSRKPNRYAAQITHEPEATDALFKMSKRFYDFSPPEHKPETKYNNTRLLEFNTKDGQGLNSGFRVATAGKEDFGSGQLIHYCHLCMALDTPILTEHGVEKLAQDVALGDVVITHTGEAAKISHITRKPGGDVLKVRPWMGRDITLTPEHKVWTNMGWVEAGKLDPSWHMLAMPIRKITDKIKSLPVNTNLNKFGPRYSGPAEFELNEDTGYSVGYYLAEGNISRSNSTGKHTRTSFTLHHGEDAFAERAVAPLLKYCRGGKARIKNRPGTLTKTYTLDSGALATFIHTHFGSVSSKHIPDWVFDCGKDFCRGLVAGYLAGDGSKGLGGSHQNYVSNSISATSIRSSIAYQIRDLVAALGYGWGSVRHKKGGVLYGRNCQESWIVHYNGKCGYRLRKLIGIEAGDLGARYKAGERYRLDTNNNQVWMKIRSISSDKVDEVIDFEVDHPDHSFRTPHFSVSNSEVSKWESGNIESLLTSILQCVPDDPESEVAFESTAKGMGGVFYDRFWGARYRIFVKAISAAGNPVIEQTVNEDAPPDNNYTSIFLPWFVFEEYQMQLPPGFVLTAEESAIKRKHGLTDEQMYWRRYTIANKCDGKVEIFQQEYPATPQEAFIGSGRPVFDVVKLAALREALPKPIARYDLVTTTGQWVARPDGRLRVWEEPSVRKAYIIGADVAEGLKDGDFSVADVIDHRTGKQVAQWHGKMSAMDFSKVLIALGQRYNEAFIACERNNHGYTVNESLGNSSYPNSRIYTEPRPEFPHKSRKRLGWVTSNATRPMMIDNLMQEVNEDSHGIVCMETIDEMMTFSIQDNGRMEADVGRKDDRVMSYAIAKKVRQKVPLPAFNQNPHFKKLDTTGRTERKVDRKAWM